MTEPEPAPPKKRRGRPSTKFTDQQREDVVVLAELGTPQDTIARVMGISRETLAKFFGEELSGAKEFCKAKVKLKIFKLCMDEDRAMLMFFAKTQMGWRETQHIEHSGNINIPGMTDEQLAQLEARLSAAIGKDAG